MCNLKCGFLCIKTQAADLYIGERFVNVSVVDFNFPYIKKMESV